MNTQEFPQLYALSSTGRTKTWKIKVEENPDGTATVTSEFGQLGGKLQTKVEKIREGKNLGKANETTPYQQAVAEAQSDYQRKLDKKYLPELPTEGNEPDILLPMLALNYRHRKHDIAYPGFVQPKLNGVRCLARKINDREIRFTTRKYKDFPEEVTAHLVQPLLRLMHLDEILDGEFYCHGWSFQKITRTVKKVRPWAMELEFHIFDLVDCTTPFWQRNGCLYERFFFMKRSGLQFVQTHPVESQVNVKSFHDQFVGLGYEGVIIRNAAGLYVMDHRSKDLQKYKEFIDEEFEIAGGKAEVIVDPVTHVEVGAVVFKCRIKGNGLTFDVRPKGSVAERVKMFQDLDNLIGKQLTVRYQELSEDGKPIFPVGLAVRDYE